MKLVQFVDGKFGVRRGIWPWFKFLDLKCSRFWWSPESAWFRDCKGSREEADRAFNIATNGSSHRVVKQTGGAA